jgi:hypothetical protein
MVIEPPRQTVSTAVFEVDYGILVAVEQTVFKELTGPVDEAAIVEFSMGIYARLVKAREDGGRTGPVETSVVVANAHLHSQLAPRIKTVTSRTNRKVRNV